MNIPSLADMLIAHERIKPHIHRTPVLTSRIINELSGAELFFKCENLQKGGAFKARGASQRRVRSERRAGREGRGNAFLR